MRWCVLLTDQSLAAIATHLTSLELLCIDHLPRVTDAGISALCGISLTSAVDGSVSAAERLSTDGARSLRMLSAVYCLRLTDLSAQHLVL